MKNKKKSTKEKPAMQEPASQESASQESAMQEPATQEPAASADIDAVVIEAEESAETESAETESAEANTASNAESVSAKTKTKIPAPMLPLIAMVIAVIALGVSLAAAGYLITEQRKTANRIDAIPSGVALSDLSALEMRILGEITKLKGDFENLAATRNENTNANPDSDAFDAALEKLEIRIDGLYDLLAESESADTTAPTASIDETATADTKESKPWWSFFGGGITITRIGEEDN